jgi:hypothetical protein
VGNISLFATKEDIAKHFDCVSMGTASLHCEHVFCWSSLFVYNSVLDRVGSIADIRMLTDKNTGKFRGAAFIELSNDEAYQVAAILCFLLLTEGLLCIIVGP